LLGDSFQDLFDKDASFIAKLSVLGDFVRELLFKPIELLCDPSSLFFIRHLPFVWLKCRGNDVLKGVLFSNGQGQKVEIINDEPEVVSWHDLGLNFCPLSKSVAHDSNQHVQEMSDDQESWEEEQCIENYSLRFVSIVEAFSWSSSQEHLDHEPHRWTKSRVW